ncbi:NADPH--hemoprotein reductase [Ascochyta rabiei]|uniref:NADPH--cytochrome P450 reductase n=1 Tax=Didymella rabiei TaxID=5454 RepID=A0A163EX04_DIDRA|nr:NADPH--hemoprotein reductase [Ascochyta rabiei]KZM23984.1 FMN binding [Ascochyta rabiei]UPX19005.1 NADPH--hemoprotein reductase [Ascochyta rabiei]
MAQLDTLDIVVLAALLLGTVAYFTKGTYWAVAADPYGGSGIDNSDDADVKSRDIVKKMEESDKDCVVFYGSQTGTAEDYAARIAKEGHARFGLKTMVADMEEYDYDILDTFPDHKLAVFVMATYGEGEPTDNAVEFFEFIAHDEPNFSGVHDEGTKPLANLNYVAFGLGNNTYEHYNSVIRHTDKHLTRLGATRLGPAGEGDDGAGTMEEDFLAWKEGMWAAVAEQMKLDERESSYEPVFEITEREDLSPEHDTVYLGEPNANHLEGKQKGPFNANNPFIAPIVESSELFTTKERNCLHMEISIEGSKLSYTTGDHIAIWPNNAGKEVDRLFKVLDKEYKRHTVIAVKALDPTAKVPFPSPTTYDAAIRFHMEICGTVSRQLVANIAQFAPNDDVKAEMAKLGSDKDYFKQKVTNRHLNLAQLLEIEGHGQTWTKVPFSFLIEGFHKIQPRYYSISSSSLVQNSKISITAVVDSYQKPDAPHVLKGVTTNYLLALKQKQHGDPSPDPHGLSYSITGPRNKYDGIHVPIHIRHSNFKLPSDPSKPIIMVGPGTGVAPFRGFIQERAAQAKAGRKVGKTILFFGCRKKSEDFMYEKEWEQYKEALGDNFVMHTAFSRDGPNKVYVQHLIEEHGEEVNKLLEQKAYFYVCGDAAHMAREVNTLLGKIIAKYRNVPEAKGEDVVKAMRASNQYQEDVWS